jgi:hypothetical protein
MVDFFTVAFAFLAALDIIVEQGGVAGGGPR